MTQNAESYHDPEFLEAVQEVFGTRAEALSPEALKQLHGLWDAGRRSVVKKEKVKKAPKTPEQLLQKAKNRMMTIECAFCKGRGTTGPNEPCFVCKGSGHMAWEEDE